MREVGIFTKLLAENWEGKSDCALNSGGKLYGGRIFIERELWSLNVSTHANVGKLTVEQTGSGGY